ncbi:MAG: iron ABC transporter permease [Chloroflexi bacterium]|nr:iron ABC transporter permease [Chloroflexota bacterium]
MSSTALSPVKGLARRNSTFLLSGLGVLPRLVVVCSVLAVLLFAAMVFAASTGPTTIPAADVANAILQYIGIDRGVDVHAPVYRIVTVVRLPGLMVAALVGAAFACAGATMQGLFRNPLADPGIIGVSAGASLGVVLVITQFAALDNLWLLNNGPLSNALWRIPAGAFIGAVISSTLVYVLSLQRGRVNIAALLLAGIALNSVLGAFTSALLLRTSNYDAVHAILSWLVGSLEGRGWDYFHLAKWPIIVSIGLLLLYTRDLNLLVIGEENAQSLGVNVAQIRLVLLVLSSLITASAVSIAGAIGFVGLIVPHILRLVIGPDNRILLPASVIGGAAFLVFADAVARSVIAPEQLPVGIVTALIGGPFFLFLLWRNRRSIAAF